MDIGILGTGAYGVALSTFMNNNHQKVKICTNFDD